MIPTLVFAFTAGAVATVNPCGVAMLPVWFLRPGPHEASVRARILGVLGAGIGATGGFLVVFSLASAVLALGFTWLGTAFPIFGLSVGLGLTLVGLLGLVGWKPGRVPGLNRCLRLNPGRGSVTFGISFALVSLSCTLPIFLAVAELAITGNLIEGFAGIIAYAAGMGTVLTVIGLFATSLREGFATLPAAALTMLQKLGSGLVVLAGLYVTYYWGRVLFGDPMAANEMVAFGDAVSSTLNTWISGRTGRWLSGVLFLSLLAGGIFAYLSGRSGATAGQRGADKNRGQH